MVKKKMERAVQNECIIKRKLSRLCKLSLSAVQKVKGKKVEFVSGKMGCERERKGGKRRKEEREQGFVTA